MTADGKIKVSLFGGLSMKTPRGDVTEESAGVGTVQDLIKVLQLREHDVGTVLINGKAARLDTKIQAGDEVALFKPRG